MNTQPGDKVETLGNVLRDIKKGGIASCYLLYGEEEYLIQDAFNKILDLLIPQADRDLNLYSVDGQQENISDICLALLSMPLIPGRKIVAVKDTRLFQSKKALPGLVNKVRDNMESNPSRAAGDFLQLLRLAGWKLDDFRDGGWKRITDGDWQKNVPGDSGEDREKWLPKIVDLCTESGLESEAAGENTEGLNRIIAGGIPEGTHLILTAQEVDKRKSLFKQIAETGKTLYFSRARDEKKQKFLLLEAAQELLSLKGKKLAPDAWQALGRKTGFDLRESIAAIEKLITYAGDKPVIDAGDVEDAIGKTKEEKGFDLTGALAEKNLPRSLMLLEDLLDQGIHHLAIMKMIIKEMRLILYAKLAVMSGKMESYSPNMDFSRFQSGIYPILKDLCGTKKNGPGILSAQHPYVVYKLLKNSGNFSYKRILDCMEYLVRMEVSLRSTGKDPKLMLERFFVEVCLN
jgi:DNA polymerase III subunit delta